MRDEVEELAVRLRRLKDRTDRSYGSLARRLNMNTSTLHRYCAGEAVPQDFAPVERLAAFCGATPQERLELHRLWLSAVAARQRVGTADTAQGPTTTPTPTPTSAPIPTSVPAPTPALAPAPAPAPGTGRARVEESGGSEVVSGDGPDPGEVPPRCSPRSVRRPWYRRRSILASTAVACVLLAAFGGMSALPDHRSAGADAARSAARGRTAAESPDRSATAPAVGSAPTSAAQPAAGPPLAWSVDSLVWDNGCDHDYVIDKPPARVPAPPSEQDAGAWAAAQGAVHGRQTKVRIAVQGRSSTAVVLEALRVRVVSRGTPRAGSAYAMGQGCGSDLTPRRFAVNLDRDRPVAHPKDGADGERTVPAVHFPYRVSAEDPEVLLVDATTQSHDTRWYLELDWSSQGRTGTVRIDDHGRPFRTTGIKGMPYYWYGTNDAGARAWVTP
ncbi:helix-turn-helix domain-containing protein [Streptomyces sp. NPDC001595]|uniref:helix-turn-helix domain-containing protein n=1 Tax=Streptomyces sp. NPDC001532 TaxID=3154520 RepID=UPI003332305D